LRTPRSNDAALRRNSLRRLRFAAVLELTVDTHRVAMTAGADKEKMLPVTHPQFFETKQRTPSHGCVKALGWIDEEQ